MKERRRLSFERLVIIWALVVAIGLVVTPVMAQDGGEPEQVFANEIVTEGDPGPDFEFEESFGQNHQVTWIPSENFTPFDSSTTYGYWAGGYRYLTNGFYMDAGIRLPSGARLIVARLYYYDYDAARNPYMVVYRFLNPLGTEILCELAAPSGTPGFTNSAAGCSNINHTIANSDNTYVVRVVLSGAAGDNLRFRGVRLAWHRQVRTGLPNPFDDISAYNARFQNAIKALAASGITKGCDANSFCPGANVIRGEMAVFLAEALGLHWDLRGGY